MRLMFTTHHLLLFYPPTQDDEAVARLTGGLPPRLTDAGPSNMPLVLPLRKFLVMMDASMPQPFFNKTPKGVHTGSGGAGLAGVWDGLEGGQEAQHSSRGVGRAAAKEVRGLEVDYDRFSAVYWEHMDHRLCKGLSCSTLWTEIISTLKVRASSKEALFCDTAHIGY